MGWDMERLHEARSEHYRWNGPPDEVRIEFDDLPLHHFEAGQPPRPVWGALFSGVATVNASGEIIAVALNTSTRQRPSDPVHHLPVGHELFRALAGAIRHTHAREIVEAFTRYQEVG